MASAGSSSGQVSVTPRGTIISSSVGSHLVPPQKVSTPCVLVPRSRPTTLLIQRHPCLQPTVLSSNPVRQIVGQLRPVAAAPTSSMSGRMPGSIATVHSPKVLRLQLVTTDTSKVGMPSVHGVDVTPTPVRAAPLYAGSPVDHRTMHVTVLSSASGAPSSSSTTIQQAVPGTADAVAAAVVGPSSSTPRKRARKQEMHTIDRTLQVDNSLAASAFYNTTGAAHSGSGFYHHHHQVVLREPEESSHHHHSAADSIPMSSRGLLRDFPPVVECRDEVKSHALLLASSLALSLQQQQRNDGSEEGSQEMDDDTLMVAATTAAAHTVPYKMNTLLKESRKRGRRKKLVGNVVVSLVKKRGRLQSSAVKKELSASDEDEEEQHEEEEAVKDHNDDEEELTEKSRAVHPLSNLSESLSLPPAKQYTREVDVFNQQMNNSIKQIKSNVIALTNLADKLRSTYSRRVATSYVRRLWSLTQLAQEDCGHLQNCLDQVNEVAISCCEQTTRHPPEQPTRQSRRRQQLM